MWGPSGSATTTVSSVAGHATISTADPPSWSLPGAAAVWPCSLRDFMSTSSSPEGAARYGLLFGACGGLAEDASRPS
jgi:hypothetical protein